MSLNSRERGTPSALQVTGEEPSGQEGNSLIPAQSSGSEEHGLQTQRSAARGGPSRRIRKKRNLLRGRSSAHRASGGRSGHGGAGSGDRSVGSSSGGVRGSGGRFG